MSEDSVASGDVPLSSPSEPQLLVKRHIKYCKRTVSVLPSSAQPLDTSRCMPSLPPPLFPLLAQSHSSLSSPSIDSSHS